MEGRGPARLDDDVLPSNLPSGCSALQDGFMERSLFLFDLLIRSPQPPTNQVLALGVGAGQNPHITQWRIARIFTRIDNQAIVIRIVSRPSKAARWGWRAGRVQLRPTRWWRC